MLYFSDGTNYKPNYQSIMNYAWQFPAGASTAFNASWQLDYSRTAFPTLNEASLNESAGIGGYARPDRGDRPAGRRRLRPDRPGDRRRRLERQRHDQ